MSNNDSGALAEDYAKHYLKQQGLTFVQANFRCRNGEIDLIMRDKDALVFVEVKARKSASHGSGLEAVDHRKQQKLIRAGQYYLQQHRQSECICRFDVISIDINSDQLSVNQWVVNAFNA